MSLLLAPKRPMFECNIQSLIALDVNGLPVTLTELDDAVC
jgi:hypothetical protein